MYSTRLSIATSTNYYHYNFTNFKKSPYLSFSQKMCVNSQTSLFFFVIKSFFLLEVANLKVKVSSKIVISYLS